MIIRKLKEIENSNRDISWGNGNSRRFLLKEDNMGYTLTDTIIDENTESYLEYKNHLEACYCIEGYGEIETKHEAYAIEPGTMYALDNHEPHRLRAKTKMRLICVFNPPLSGSEIHQLNKDGASSY
jgi:L-ectoine synthase